MEAVPARMLHTRLRFPAMLHHIHESGGQQTAGTSRLEPEDLLPSRTAPHLAFGAADVTGARILRLLQHGGRISSVKSTHDSPAGDTARITAQACARSEPRHVGNDWHEHETVCSLQRSTSLGAKPSPQTSARRRNLGQLLQLAALRDEAAQHSSHVASEDSSAVAVEGAEAAASEAARAHAALATKCDEQFGVGTPGSTKCAGKVGEATPPTPEMPVPPDPFALVRMILNAIMAIIKPILTGMIQPVLDPIMAIIQFVLSTVVEALLLGGAQSMMSSLQDLAAMATQMAAEMAKAALKKAMKAAEKKGMEMAKQAQEKAIAKAQEQAAKSAAQAGGAAAGGSAVGGSTAAADAALAAAQSNDPAERAQAQAKLREAESATVQQLASVPDVQVPPGLGLLQREASTGSSGLFGGVTSVSKDKMDAFRARFRAWRRGQLAVRGHRQSVRGGNLWKTREMQEETTLWGENSGGGLGGASHGGAMGGLWQFMQGSSGVTSGHGDQGTGSSRIGSHSRSESNSRSQGTSAHGSGFPPEIHTAPGLDAGLAAELKASLQAQEDADMASQEFPPGDGESHLSDKAPGGLASEISDQLQKVLEADVPIAFATQGARMAADATSASLATKAAALVTAVAAPPARARLLAAVVPRLVERLQMSLPPRIALAAERRTVRRMAPVLASLVTRSVVSAAVPAMAATRSVDMVTLWHCQRCALDSESEQGADEGPDGWLDAGGPNSLACRECAKRGGSATSGEEVGGQNGGAQQVHAMHYARYYGEYYAVHASALAGRLVEAEDGVEEEWGGAWEAA